MNVPRQSNRKTQTTPKSLCYMCHLNVKHFSYDLEPAEASVSDGALKGEDATTSFIHQPAPTLLLLTATHQRQTASEAQSPPKRK